MSLIVSDGKHVDGRPLMGASALPWLATSAVVVAADHATKYWALSTLPEHTAVPVFASWWNWYRFNNTGAAFSLLSAVGGWQRHALAFFALGTVVLLTFRLARLPRNAWQPIQKVRTTPPAANREATRRIGFGRGDGSRYSPL